MNLYKYKIFKMTRILQVINMERHDTAPRAANTNMRSLQSTNGGIDRLLLCTTVLLDREGTDR
jgi:hypothetical protein